MTTGNALPTLHPSLWKTCRVLANENRLDILRLLCSTKEDLAVEEIARRVGLTPASASLYLKHLQARGFCAPRHVRKNVFYHVKPDKCLPDSHILLHVLMRLFPHLDNPALIHELTAITHSTRIQILTAVLALQKANDAELEHLLGLSERTYRRHRAKLLARGWLACSKDGQLTFPDRPRAFERALLPALAPAPRGS